MLSEYWNIDQEKKINKFLPFTPETSFFFIVNTFRFNIFTILILSVSVCIDSYHLVSILMFIAKLLLGIHISVQETTNGPNVQIDCNGAEISVFQGKMLSCMSFRSI